jgi:hypothetical protein
VKVQKYLYPILGVLTKEMKSATLEGHVLPSIRLWLSVGGETKFILSDFVRFFTGVSYENLSTQREFREHPVVKVVLYWGGGS